MDHRPTVDPESAAPTPRTIQGEQAVFTSIRTPTGAGYRIIAASAGLKPEEKAEITRRSPSHGNLCQEGEDARGLLSYRLSTGRRCVGFCCHAGTEHTGRGGQRVYTHLAILDSDDFAATMLDTLSVYKRLAEQVGKAGPVLQMNAALEPFSLTATDEPVVPRPDLKALDGKSDWLWPVVGGLLAERRLIVSGVREPVAFVEAVEACLPAYARANINLSAGVAFSPSRQLQFVVIGPVDASIQRLIAGQNITLWDAQKPAVETEPRYRTWCNFARECLTSNGVAHLAQTAAEITQPVDGEGLARIVDEKKACAEPIS